MKNIALTLITSMMALSVQATTQEDIKSFTLDNGMKILVLEDSSIPNANMYLFWKVGSRNEPTFTSMPRAPSDFSCFGILLRTPCCILKKRAH